MSHVNLIATNGKLELNGLVVDDRIEVYATNGQRVVSTTASGSNFTTSLNKGIYIINVKSAGISKVTKVVMN